MKRQGYGADCLIMDGCPSPTIAEIRLEAFLKKNQQECLGCGARPPHKAIAPHEGHKVGCSLVAWWKIWDEVLTGGA